MLVDNKHTSLYWKGEQIPVGVTDIEDEAAEFYAKRGLVNIVGEPKQLEVATPKKEEKKAKPKTKKKPEETKPEEDTESEDTESEDEKSDSVDKAE